MKKQKLLCTMLHRAASETAYMDDMQNVPSTLVQTGFGVIVISMVGRMEPLQILDQTVLIVVAELPCLFE